MTRCLLVGVAFVLVSTAVASAQGVVATDTPLYRAQGEYAGALGGLPHGAQVVALTDGTDERLRLVLYEGGLPGAGWRPGRSRVEVEAPHADGAATFTKGWTATLRDGAIVFRTEQDGPMGELRRVERVSPTLGSAPPPGAVVLFDGSSADAFTDGRLTARGELAVGCDSKHGFQGHRIHLEFKTPFMPGARGQGRGNSGVYVQGRYECQVLDSFGLEGRANECGGIYSVAAPIVNACLPPETWQTYDIVFTAARFEGDTKVADARMIVHLNGILVHDDVAVPKATAAHRRAEGPGPGGLYLQDHGNPVVYRNVWVVEDDPARTRCVVFLAGRRSHGYAAHEHRAGCLLLAKALDASGLRVETTVVDLWPADQAVLERADAIVCFADGGPGHPLLRHLGELDALMARGIGLVLLHWAVEVPAGAPGERVLDWIGGHYETDWSVNPFWTAEFSALPAHPITRGVRPFAIHDEWYFHMRFRPGLEAVTPILSAVAPASTMSRPDGPHSGNPAARRVVSAGTPQHVAWARVRPDGGRGFGFTGAHVHWNWAHDDFRKLVLNAIAWCARVPVPEGGVASSAPDLAALQANQDFEPDARFDAAAVQRLLDSFPHGR